MKKVTKKKLLIPREPTPRLLAFDPTPAGLITQPFRTKFSYRWKRLREDHFGVSDFQCEICQAIESEARLIHGHEVYSYPNPDTVRLERVAFLCTRCHDAIHFERSRARCQPPYIRTLTEHYCKVNGGLSEEDFRQDITGTFSKMLSVRAFYGGANARPGMDYGPVIEQVERVRQRWLAWRQAYERELQVIQTFLDRHTSTEWDENGELPPKPGFYTQCEIDHIWEMMTEEHTRKELAKYLATGNVAQAEALIADFFDFADDEMLPDHECPRATAMWRDTFSTSGAGGRQSGG